MKTAGEKTLFDNLKGKHVEIVLTDSDMFGNNVVIRGKLKDFNRYTVLLDVGDQDILLFKHSIKLIRL